MTMFNIWDCETTGLPLSRTVPLDKQPRICELGIILYDSATDAVVDSFSQLINPGIPMPADVIKIHGIRDEDVATMPPFPEVWERARKFFQHPVMHCVAHNAPFDTGMLDFEFRRMGVQVTLPHIICSCQEYIHLFGKRPKLTELYEKFTSKKYEHRHRAIDDTRILLEALQAAKFFQAFATDAIATIPAP